ncbi:MAG: CRISPR-associated endonuclease Cas2 [Acidobacteria bacterium]|nr:CRISPR-associated endonuclease Cas2 [Acidobacteriota bacterium]
MQTFVACFDITDDRIRRMVSRRLEHFGIRVQRSVFEISVRSPTQLLHLKKELNDWIEPGDDIRFYNLCLSCRKKSCDCADTRIAEFPSSVVI